MITGNQTGGDDTFIFSEVSVALIVLFFYEPNDKPTLV